VVLLRIQDIMQCHWQGQIQVMWGLKLIQFLGPPFRKRIRNYEYKIMYGSEYLFRAPPRVPEGAHASERSWSLSFISFTVNLPLVIAQVVHDILNDHSIFTFNIPQSKEEEFFSDDLTLQNVSKYSANGTDSYHTRHRASSFSHLIMNLTYNYVFPKYLNFKKFSNGLHVYKSTYIRSMMLIRFQAMFIY